MKVILHLAAVTVLLGSAFGQIDSVTLHNQYGEPEQEVFAVRPGYRMTVLYGPQHQICELDISSGRLDDFASSQATNAVLDEVVNEMVPDSIRGPKKSNLDHVHRICRRRYDGL
jgi:hypothetical protein